MDLNLTGKTALVTGASAGIGKAVAAALHREGCAVHMVSRSLQNLQSAAAEIAPEDPAALGLHAQDLADGASVARIHDAVGTPDILVNNAGAIPAGDLQAITEERWREGWDLKVFGYINMTRVFLAAMTERGQGVILNITGNAADCTDPGYIAGSAGNAGLNAFTQALGGRSLNSGVRVLGVSPGPVATDRIVRLLRTRAEAESGDPQRWQSYLANLPLGRAARVEEVADVVAFLVSERAGYVSGIVVSIDGGHSAKRSSFT